MIRAKKLSNLTAKEQIGEITLIWRKCTKKSTKAFVLLVLPVSIQKLNGGTRMEKLLRQWSKRLAEK